VDMIITTMNLTFNACYSLYTLNSNDAAQLNKFVTKNF
jgi:hypothetical protein